MYICDTGSDIIGKSNILFPFCSNANQKLLQSSDIKPSSTTSEERRKQAKYGENRFC